MNHPPSLGQSAGLIFRPEALALGYNDRAIRQLIRSGIWHRVRPGAYIDAATWREYDATTRHRVLARAVLANARCGDVVLSHMSAALELGAPTWDLGLDSVDLTRLDRRSGRHEAGVRQHRGALQAGNILDLDGVRLTDGTRTAIDVSTQLDVEHGLVVVNSLLHGGHTTHAQLVEMADALDRSPGTLHARIVLAVCDSRIESVGESRTSYLIWRHGLPLPVPQYEIFDETGQLFARLDFAWPELGVFLEFDGRSKYTTLRPAGADAESVLIAERRRENRICELTGWRCIRITWADLANPERLVARIRALMATRPAA